MGVEYKQMLTDYLVNMEQSEKENENTMVISNIQSKEDVQKMIHSLKNVKNGTTICFFGNYPYAKLFEYIPKNIEVFIKNYGRKYNINDLEAMGKNFWVYDMDNDKAVRDGLITQKVIVRPTALLKREKFYLDILSKIEEENLTPLEALTYIYYKVISTKNARQFKAGDVLVNNDVHSTTNDWNSAKNTALVLADNYMDCKGTSELIIEAVEQLNMPGLTADRVRCHLQGEGHQINKFIINDSFYGVNGVYFCDSIPDNKYTKNYMETSNLDVNLNFISHFLLTKEEMQKMKNYEFRGGNHIINTIENSKNIDGTTYALLLNKLGTINGVSSDVINDFLFLSSICFKMSHGFEKYFGHENTEKVENYLNKSSKK